MHRNSTAVGPVDVGGLAYPVGAALFLGGLAILVLWTTGSRRRARPSLAVTPKCYRVQEIPIEITEDELRRRLAECLPGHDASSLRLTLARSSAEHRTATLVSPEPPKSLGYPVDSLFLGITPLCEKDNAAVEYATRRA